MVHIIKQSTRVCAAHNTDYRCVWYLIAHAQYFQLQKLTPPIRIIIILFSYPLLATTIMSKQSTKIVHPLKIKINRKNMSTKTVFVDQDTNIFNFNNTPSRETNESRSYWTHRNSSVKWLGNKSQNTSNFLFNTKSRLQTSLWITRGHCRRNGYYCKTSQKNVNLQTNTSNGYRLIINFLNAHNNAQFYTFQFGSEKSFGVSIHYLHPCTACYDIKLALENVNLTVLQVVNVLQRHTKVPLPLFFVDLAKIEKQTSISKPSLQTKIKIEKPHKSCELMQCQNCQDYGHTRTNCNYTHAASSTAKIMLHRPATNRMSFHPPARSVKETICQHQKMSIS